MMAGLLTYIVKLILKIVLYLLRSYYKGPNRTANSVRSQSVKDERTSSPVEEYPRRDVNFSREVSSVHSAMSNSTNVQYDNLETFAEYDVPGEEQTLNLGEQKQLLERLREENRCLQMEMRKKNMDDFDQLSDAAMRNMDDCSSKLSRKTSPRLSVDDVFTAEDKDEREEGSEDFGSPLIQPADVLPIKLRKRRRNIFLTVDDVSTVRDIDVIVDKAGVSRLRKRRSVDVLPYTITTHTRRIFLNVSDVSTFTDPTVRGDEDDQQISHTGTRRRPSDEEMSEDTQHIPENRGHAVAGKRNQTEYKNTADMIRIIKQHREENSHLKMYIRSFMGKVLSEQPSLLKR